MNKHGSSTAKRGPSRRLKRRAVRLDKSKHHLLFPEAEWQGEWANTLREFPGCQVQLPYKHEHSKIHTVVHGVACPPEDVCQKIYLELLGLDTEDAVALIGAPLPETVRRLAPVFKKHYPAALDGLYAQVGSLPPEGRC